LDKCTKTDAYVHYAETAGVENRKATCCCFSNQPEKRRKRQ